MLNPTAIQQQLMGNLNSNAQISAWCAAIDNTTVVQSTGTWYQPFMTNLAIAKGHASTYLNVIGPDAWSTLPNAIVNYSSTHNNTMSDVQGILSEAGLGDLTADQVSTIV